jgi:hypothetical protein
VRVGKVSPMVSIEWLLLEMVFPAILSARSVSRLSLRHRYRGFC